MESPAPCGLLSSSLFGLLREPADTDAARTRPLGELVAAAVAGTSDIFNDEDLQLALFCLYELHYSRLAGSDEGWEWNPGLITARALIESAFERALRTTVELPSLDATDSTAVQGVRGQMPYIRNRHRMSWTRCATKAGRVNRVCITDLRVHLMQAAQIAARCADPRAP